MMVRTPRLRTILDLFDPSFDCAPGIPWRPRGAVAFMGLGNAGYEDGDMHVTTESTDARWRRLQFLLGADDLRFVDGVDAERLELKDELQALQAAPVDRAAHARDTRTADKRKLCEDAINGTRAWLNDHGPSERVSHLLEHLGKHKEFYGYSELPSREYVKAMLKEQGL
jgi:hypothetical protein